MEAYLSQIKGLYIVHLLVNILGIKLRYHWSFLLIALKVLLLVKNWNIQLEGVLRQKIQMKFLKLDQKLDYELDLR